MQLLASLDCKWTRQLFNRLSMKGTAVCSEEHSRPDVHLNKEQVLPAPAVHTEAGTHREQEALSGSVEMFFRPAAQACFND
jgi:hypothetical protein